MFIKCKDTVCQAHILKVNHNIAMIYLRLTFLQWSDILPCTSINLLAPAISVQAHIYQPTPMCMMLVIMQRYCSPFMYFQGPQPDRSLLSTTLSYEAFGPEPRHLTFSINCKGTGPISGCSSRTPWPHQELSYRRYAARALIPQHAMNLRHESHSLLSGLPSLLAMWRSASLPRRSTHNPGTHIAHISVQLGVVTERVLPLHH